MTFVKARVLDLFAGCGGFSSGLEMAGLEVVAANDIWEPAAMTHQRNHKNSRFFLGSITDPDLRKQIVEYCQTAGCDVIVGGPPCQAYSLAGARNVDDARGHLFKDYVSTVAALRPKVFVMENVKGILTMAHDRNDLSAEEQGQLDELKKLESEKSALMLLRKQSKNTNKYAFTEENARRLEQVKHDIKLMKTKLSSLREKVTDLILRSFNAIGYRVEFRTLNAADYGAPQKRERVIFIGTRLNTPICFPEPTHFPDQADQNGQMKLISSNTLKHVTVRQAIDDLKGQPEDQAFSHIFSKHKPEFIKRIHETPIGKSVYGDYSDSWYRNPPDEPSRTVKENHGGVLVHYSEDRVMTPRELARLQTFPDDFLFSGSKSEILVQIGNAVPPYLGKAVGIAVMRMLMLAQQNNT